MGIAIDAPVAVNVVGAQLAVLTHDAGNLVEFAQSTGRPVAVSTLLRRDADPRAFPQNRLLIERLAVRQDDGLHRLPHRRGIAVNQ